MSGRRHGLRWPTGLLRSCSTWEDGPSVPPMLDQALRSRKDRLLNPIAERAAQFGVSPHLLTTIALSAGIAAAAVAAIFPSYIALSFGLWVMSRSCDGLDGPVARRLGRPSDIGGYSDLLGDFVVYAALPLGLAWGHPSPSAWPITAALLASFYLNAASWLYPAAILERIGAERRAVPARLDPDTERWSAEPDSSPGRDVPAKQPKESGCEQAPRRHPAQAKRTTTVAMPRGIMEGTETLVFFSLFLLFPALYPWIAALMAVLVALSAGHRWATFRSILQARPATRHDTR